MKKLLLSLMLIIAAVGYTAAQDVVVVVPEKLVTVESPAPCKYVPVSHWSIGVYGGANYFRVAPGVIKREESIHNTLGATLEYTVNPLVGLGLEYGYNPYGHPYQLNPTQVGELEGRTHDAVIYGSINLANLLIPYRTGGWSRMNVYGNAGVGVGFYQFKQIDASNNVIVDSRNIGDGVPQTVMGKAAFNLEYNISNTFALGGAINYRYYDRTNLGGDNMYRGFSDALTATIGLRVKFGANGNKQHARNISICEYYPTPAPVVIEKIVKDNTVETMNRLTKLEAENAALYQRIKNLENDSIFVTRFSNDNVVASFRNIEFEFGSDRLSRDSYATLDQIAETLKDNNNNVRLNVSGYTDYVGTEEFNKQLSLDRANAVKAYMLTKNVPASRITIKGYGESNPIGTNETEEGRQKNRRVEFELTK